MQFHRSQFVLALSAGLCLSAGAFAQDTATSGPVNVGSAPAAPASKYKLSATQLAEAQARVQLANSIAQNVSADAKAKGLNEDWRINLLSDLYNTPSSALRNIDASASTLDQAHALADTARQQAAAAKTAASASAAGHASSAGDTADNLGSVTDSLVFTPKTPCRFIDTRVTGGAIGTSARVFDTFNFGSSYGGSSSCTMPGLGEPAIAANVTIVSPSVAAGYLAVRPYGSTNLTSWLNWYQAAAVTANAGIISTALNGSHYDFEILTGGGTVQVVLDYFGYFSAAAATALSVTTGTYESYSVPAGFSSYHYTTATCPSGYTPISAYCYNAGDPNVYLTGSGVNGGAWCGWRNLNGSATSVSQNVFCGQIP